MESFKGENKGQNEETKIKTHFSSFRSVMRNDRGVPADGVAERFGGSESVALGAGDDRSDLEVLSFVRSVDLPAFGSTKPPPRALDPPLEEDIAR